VAVAPAGPYASLHLAPDRQPRQHPTTQDEEIHGGNDGEGNGIGEREERQEQSRPVDLPYTTDNEIKQKLERELRPA